MFVISPIWQETLKEHGCARGETGYVEKHNRNGLPDDASSTMLPFSPLHHLVRVISPFRSSTFPPLFQPITQF